MRAKITITQPYLVAESVVERKSVGVTISQPRLNLVPSVEPGPLIEAEILFANLLKGPKGDKGDPALINGHNTIEILGGRNIRVEHDGDKLVIRTDEYATFEDIDNLFN